jgi:hypothetical protein
MKQIFIYTIMLVFLTTCSQKAFAQASPTLNIQGVLRNYNGTAVDNGVYKIRFALYTVATGGTEVWSETQDAVLVTGGVYSTALGKVTPLTAAFNQTYYLGVKVGADEEMASRALLSSAPYALSLIGQGNTFPSTGAVGVGTNAPTAGNELHVKDAAGKGNILVEGTTGAAVNFKKGTATAEIGYDGTKINAAKMHIANLTVDTITMPAAAGGDLVLPAGNTISYNGLKDWRLVQVNNFETGNDGWNGYIEWNSTTTASINRFQVPGVFNGRYALGPSLGEPNFVKLKKQFDLTGVPHTEIKVVFNYYFIDSWQFSAPDFGYAGFATGLDGTNFTINWTGSKHIFSNFLTASPANYMGNTLDIDIVKTGEMTAKYSGNQFYIYFGMVSTTPFTTMLNYAIGNIEIWVK